MWKPFQNRGVLTATVLVAGYIVVSLTVPAGFVSAAFGNIVQSLLVATFLGVLLWNMMRAQGQTRLFWLMMSLGAAFWLVATLLWTWWEVIASQPVPDPFVGDVVFFVHLIPMMGALAVRPHRPTQTHRLDFGGLDFLLLILWWIYLYFVIVIPWQYALLNRVQYGYNFSVLYAIENTILIISLAILCWRTQGRWRAIYGTFLGAAVLYAVGAQIVNHAITRDQYHTGSIYDVPLVVAMMAFIAAALTSRNHPPQPMPVHTSRTGGVIAARLAMAAVLSMPCMLFWNTLSNPPGPVRTFRRTVTLIALIVLPFLVFLKQHLLDRELMGLWRESQHNYDNLKRLQAQLMQAEKLTALAQVVSGATHEINNPLTAIMGYSDLLADDNAIPNDKLKFIEKIGQQARRIREVVANLRTFAKQVPGHKSPMELNPVLANAIELRALDLGNNIQIEQELASHLPLVIGDESRLLQVCFHVIGNAIDALRQVGGGTLRVVSRAESDQVIVEFTDNGPGVTDPHRIFDPFYSTKPVGKGAGLGLSACYGIMRDHDGQILCENVPSGGAKFTISLPAAKIEPLPTAKAAAAS